MSLFRITIPILLFAGLFAAQAADTAPPQLTAAQYARAEDLYWLVMARCCVRKPGALKIHKLIEKQVAEGLSDQAILADFASRFGGQPVNLNEASSGNGDWLLVPAAGAALAGAWALILRRGQARGRNAG